MLVVVESQKVGKDYWITFKNDIQRKSLVMTRIIIMAWMEKSD